MQHPLAYNMRPKTIDEVVGQEHLLGPNKILRRMVDANMLSSIILYGPPGTGKTSIASALAGSTNQSFRKLNAATSTKKDLQGVAADAKISGGVVLLLDEIHRLDKTKQDFLLPLLEEGSVTLIGATTENPYISLSPAIRSRTQIFEVKPLEPKDIKTALKRALTDNETGLGKYEAHVPNTVLDFLSESTNGDLRSALNALELAVKSTKKNKNGKLNIKLTDAQTSLQKKSLSSDKNGDGHYDTVSAFQKSIRGSDVNAALYYLALLIESGDLVSISRRLTVIAYEDIGLANPNAALHAVTAIEAANRLGFPEARIPLADAVIELALSPKSNSGMTAIDRALDIVRSGKSGTIPDYLRDAHYKGAKDLNHGVGYKYPHSYPNHWIKQQYLPDAIKNSEFYDPGTMGVFEPKLAEIYQNIQKSKED